MHPHQHLGINESKEHANYNEAADENLVQETQLSFDKGMQYLIDRQPNTGKSHLVGFKNDE